MIYIKNTTETQTIFIPRTELQKEAYIASTKTYEDGYKDGFGKGKQYQKDQMLNLYVTENGQYEREDGWGVVTVDISIPDCSASYEEGYEIGKNEGYEDGFQNGYDQGQSNCPECDDCSGAYDEGYEIGKNKGYENGFQDGYEQGKSDCPECDECPELTSINITKNGSYEGAFKLVNVDVPNEESCKLTETSINLKKESAILDASKDGVDGYSKVTITAWAFGDVRYGEGYDKGYSDGYNQGQTDCPECEDCPELTEITITENGRYEGAYNVVNVDVPKEDCDGAYNQGYQDGYNQGQNDCPSVQEEALQYDTIAFSYIVDGWKYHNLNKDNITNDCEDRPLDCLLLRNRYGECTVMTKLDNCSGTVCLENNWSGGSIIYSLKSNTITKFSSSSINSYFLKSIDTGFAQLEENAIMNCNALTDIKVTIRNNDISYQFATNCFNGLPTEGTITIDKNVGVTLTNDEITSFFRTIVGEGWTITID